MESSTTKPLSGELSRAADRLTDAVEKRTKTAKRRLTWGPLYTMLFWPVLDEHNLKVAQAAPWSLTVDEWRAMMDLPPLPNGEGEEFVFSQNQVPERRPRDRRNNRFDDM